jgi:hypothetical protein
LALHMESLYFQLQCVSGISSSIVPPRPRVPKKTSKLKLRHGAKLSVPLKKKILIFLYIYNLHLIWNASAEAVRGRWQYSLL